MATLSERQELQSRLLAKGIEWDDQQIEAFIDNANNNQVAAQKTIDGFSSLPSSKIMGDDPKEIPTDIPFSIGSPDPYEYMQSTVPADSRSKRGFSGGAIDFVGNALWEAADMTTFGALGWADEALNEGAAEEFMTGGDEGPSTFAGRVGAGIGGLAGFLAVNSSQILRANLADSKFTSRLMLAIS